MSRTLLLVALISLKYQLLEAIYCYECNSNWQSCGSNANLTNIQYNKVQCSGSCVTFYNPNEGNVLYRSCSSGLPTIEQYGGKQGIYLGENGNYYDLCNTDGCNGVNTPIPKPPYETSVCYDSQSCSNYNLTPLECNSGFTRSICPKTCGCLAPLTTTTTTTTTTPPTTITTTKFDCYDNPTCKSYSLNLNDCQSDFTSKFCPNTCLCIKAASIYLSTTTQPSCFDNPTCSSIKLNAIDCSSTFTIAQCPNSCKCILATTTTTSAPTTSTTTVNCYDNQTCSDFNLSKIDCESSFTKDMCPNRYSSNISRILQNKDKIIASFESHDSPFKKTLKKTKLDYIDNGLRNFIANCNEKGVAVNSETLKLKAKEIAEENGDHNFKASNGYIANFKSRKSILFETIHSVSGSVDKQVIVNWNEN
ncbi:unnamed protein product [Brachionus calyciflorus]|uniref:HTH CENPB-type domain-containing protein n=1 Tax=Brachionus calyciflorus TaxID=104777 RepID=A0A814G419_9BILA|nr:unnamed protein product [Brachionus calyciflorus]